MKEQIVDFKITNFAAEVDESVPVEWQGKEFDSGPLTVELDESVSSNARKGEFTHVRYRFSLVRP